MTIPQLFSTVSRNDPLNFWGANGVVDFDRIREFADLDTRQIARMTGLKESTVRFDERIPDQVRDHMMAIANICNLVYGFFEDDVKTKLWLTTPNPMLGYITPRDMIRHGRYSKLLRFITDALEDNAAAHVSQKKK